MLTNELSAIIGARKLCTCTVSMCKIAWTEVLTGRSDEDGPSVRTDTSEADMFRYLAIFASKLTPSKISGSTSQVERVRLTTNLIKEPGGRGGGDGGGGDGGGKGDGVDGGGGGDEGGGGGKVGGETFDMTTTNMSKLFESPQLLALSRPSVPVHSLSASHQSPTLSEARSQSSLSGLSMLSV